MVLDLEDEVFQRLTNHVFLPRQLPGEEAKTLVQDEGELLSAFTSAITCTDYQSVVPISTKALFTTWENVQGLGGPPTEDNISKALKQQAKGNMFGYYVRAQNAGIFIHFDNNDATLSTFPASMKSGVIMSNYEGEVIGAFPEQSIKIPKSELLKSKALARQIVTLTNHPMLKALSTSTKAGSEHPEVREVPDTIYVSEWLVSLLSDASSKTATDHPKLCKKIRDHVVWKNSLAPFRRSGMWMTLKVILHLSLSQSALGPEVGKLLYKLLMAEFMRQMCERAKNSSVNSDIGIFMLKKLTRRVKKIQALASPGNWSEIIDNILNKTSNTCEEYKKIMVAAWQQQIKKHSTILPKLQINRLDISHQNLPQIPKLNGLAGSTGLQGTSDPPKCFSRIDLSDPEFPDFTGHVKMTPAENLEEIGKLLFDTESWIFKHMDHYSNLTAAVTSIRLLAENYISKAPFHYKENPLRTSRMILAFLKMVQVLDQIATSRYSMLKDHDAGVDPVIIQQLLLPLKSELELAHQLEVYFRERNENTEFPGLTEEDAISENSFSVRYASQNQKMLDLRKKILEDAENKILGKKGGVKQAKIYCADLRQKMASLSCTCYGQKVKNACGYHETVDTLNKLTVKVYERPLRNGNADQLAVVFELLIPPEIACLRDIITLLHSRVCKAKKNPYKIEGRIWTSYKKISKYSQGMEIQNHFLLGSTSKLFVDSHYKSQHPDQPVDSFIVNNGYNCTFEGSYVESWNVKKWTTLKVNPNSPYKDLQWTLETTNHTQNQVLARQDECPGELRLVEFKEFGSLRAGHRLQLRNIFRALIENSLSLKEESVFSLICQSTWEAGPPGANWNDRESHEPLTNPDFSSEWIKELDKQLETYQNNWTEAYTLLAVIILTSRALEFGQVTTQAVELFQKCRDTAYKWIARIEDMITKSVDKSAEQVQELRLKLLDAAICLCWTYSVDFEYIDLVVKSDRDLFLWMHGLTRIHNITSSTITTLSALRKILIDSVHSKIVLTMESKLIKFVNNGLNMFVKENWKDGCDGEFGQWTSYPAPANHVFETNFQSRTNQGNVHLQVDLLRGSFLVNGLPVGYLPENITKHPAYKRVFKNIVFEVHPAAGDGVFVTTHRYEGSDYRFTLRNNSKTLIVLERKDDEEFQLIPFEDLTGIIPYLLMRDYSHWLNVGKNWIDFRPVSFNDFEKQKVMFRFNLQTRELIELSTGNRLISVGSPTHQSTTNYLQSLEDSKYIHTILNSSEQRIEVHLPRMRLRFRVNESTWHMENLEYGMSVRPEQSFGTLIGLRNGLLLENKKNEQQKLLVPHGLAQVLAANISNEHHGVQINLETLKKPAVFIFDLDNRLKQLRAGKSTPGWFYLAHLHAITSSPLADPFTGVTGTEEAFRILQSGHCWSCKPFEQSEIRDILDAIKRLSPVRQYYPPKLKLMETIRWPHGVPSCAAHDGFRFIVDKLVSDSERLKCLFQKEKPVEDEDEKKSPNDIALSKRAYIRYEPYWSKEGKILEEFLNILPGIPQYTIGVNTRTWITSQQDVLNTRTIAESGHSWQYRPPNSQPSLTNLLLTRDELRGRSDPEGLTRKSIIDFLEFDFRNNWIDLFELARLVMKEGLKSEWTTILSILAFSGQVDFNHLLLLHGVAVHRVFFQAQDPSKLEKLFKTPNDVFNESKIREIFSSNWVKNIDVLTSLIKVLWPVKSLSLANFEDLNETYLGNALLGLNQHLTVWSHNLDLHNFVQKVASTIAVLPSVTCRQVGSIVSVGSDTLLKSIGEKPKFKLLFNDMIKAMDISEELSRIFHEGFVSSGDSTVNEASLEGQPLYECFQTQREFYRTYSNEVLKSIGERLIHTQTRGLYHADLFRVTPSALLARLGPSTRPPITSPTKAKLPRIVQTPIDALNDLIGALGVLSSLEQRAFRCMKFYSLGDPGIVMLRRERENRGHLNWSPAKFPDWLLFEVESDLMIRPVQIDVTNQMMEPPDGKHSVMQLNMGEGKTAVIVPLLALALANKKQVFRVTVLKSLFKTNAASLVASLGGLLRRRLYVFPCQRDLEITGSTAKRMLELYKECRDKSGVVITLPEHRLSFQLKGYEKCRAKEVGTAKWLFDLRNWLCSNVRDVLDESDEILHVKYQLIYTLGSQRPVDGGMLRWGIAQSLLKLLPARMADLQAHFGDSFVDMSQVLRTSRPEIFHHTRLLKKECYAQLIEWLAEDILDRKSIGIKVPDLTPENKNLLKNLLTNTEIDKGSHQRALDLLTPTQTTSILMLMGYLKYEILYLCLTKRWRVNYGVDVEGKRKMAVPFKAKDIPSKRTEFGHPDVAIMLTQLSYYYSGLSNDELEQTFDRLQFDPNKEQEYAGWIRQIPPEHVDPSIIQLSGVNLVDLEQKYELLFPVLKRNMAVIDFWLGHVVFPSESRVFEEKLVCTPWDLCSKDFLHPITGFSGTNDSTELLPAPISQQDLPQLQSTNEDMKATILMEENNHLDILPRETSAKEILDKLIQKNIPVLLDAGALMLELDNEGVARTWLQLLIDSGSSKEAAVYYDDDNELRVKHRDYLDESSPFHSSSYMDQLQKCVVYLDDVHTRGTDLRIPPPSRACVTLCAGITRDKMIQACMRMRLLGKGHTLQFFANDEAANGMSSGFTGTLGSAHVMDWVCRNSRQFEKDGLVYWATSGLNYGHKRLVETNFNKSQKTPENWVALGELCCDQEFQKLQAMYGQHREELTYMSVLKSQINRKRTDLNAGFLKPFGPSPSFELFDLVGESIIERCQQHIADKKVVSHLLDEEQEKEHEEEPEEEREIIRPPPATPAVHKLSPEVVLFMKTGDPQPGLQSGEIMKLNKGFIQTTIDAELKKNWDRVNVFVTRDFVNVIIAQNPSDTLNDFLRTPNWIAAFGTGLEPVLLILSPFEVNELIPIIKPIKDSATIRMFAPRLVPKQQTLINSAELTIRNGHNQSFFEIPKHLLPPLFVFSGTLYFLNDEEQSSYYTFLGMLPLNARTTLQEAAAIEGKIVRGFLPPEHRQEVSPLINLLCGFSNHPENIIREIIQTRHGFWPEASHVSKVVLDCRKVDNFDN